MAEANLTVGVEVALRVDEGTAQWLESQGWVRPGAPSVEPVATELDTDDEEGDWDPAEMMAGVSLADLVPEARPLATGGVYRGEAMGGAEAMRYRAKQLRTRLRGELADEGAQKDLDELLRMCDVDMKRVFGSDCDC